MLSDLRFAVRQLIKNRGFTLTAVIALGVGIGQAAGTFNAFSAILLRPMPHVQDEGRVLYLDQVQLKHTENNLGFSLPDFLDLRAQAKMVQGLTVVMNRTFILGGGSQPERALGSSISTAGFGMLGVQPLRGRLFRADEEQPGATPVAILSYGLWQRRFGGRDDLIGQTAVLNGSPVTIIGVMPAGFRFPETSELWTPFIYDLKDNSRGSHSYPVYGRLAPGVSLDQAQVELSTIAARLALQYKDTNDGLGITAKLIRDEATDDVVVLMRLMLGAVLFVLLIACANVANLLLAKSVTRSHELAIRSALGATRGRIIRQLLTESLLLGLLGGVAGLLFAVWNNAYSISAIPVELPYWMSFDFDWRVFVFTTAVTIVSALAFGLFPALQASRSTALELKEGGRGGTGSPRALRLRQILVVAQIALALVLLIGAGLMVRSFINLQNINPGFDPHGVVTFRVGLPPTQFKDKAQIRRFFDQLTPRLAALPGVEAAGATTMLPASGMNINAFSIEGQPPPKTLMASPFAVHRTITTGYLAAMRIPLLRGRDFTADDTDGKPRVLLVDQAFADRWFPGQDVLGKRISFGEDNGVPNWTTIVGVVGTVPQRIGSDAPKFGAYSPVAQDELNFLSYALRVKGDPTTYQSAIQHAVLSVQPEIPIYNVQTMEKGLAISYWQKKFFGHVFTNYGLVALFLASLGIYGVMAYSVTQRTQEIGVRMALGAQPRDVLRLVGRQGFRLVSLGIGIGLVAALGLTRFMAGFLYGVSPSDPPTYFALSTVLALVAFIACWLPAKRATRVDPIVALRAE